VGALPRVFAVGCKELDGVQSLDRRKKVDWSVPAIAQVGDLIVMYRTRPASEIRDLWRVVGPFYVDKQWGHQAWLRKLAQLANPLTRRQLVGDPTTRGLGVVRRKFRGKSDITEEWPQPYDKIVALNPDLRTSLRDYNPDRL
jgi:hypothetical protein